MIERRTMLVMVWGGTSIWMPDDRADLAVARSKHRGKKRVGGSGIAYIVRCRPPGTRSNNLGRIAEEMGLGERAACR